MSARILVVEDNDLNRRLVRDVLQHGGHRVIEAVDVAQGQQRLRDGLPDIVLLDIHIPGGGENLLAHIRGDDRLRSLVVVAVTASAMHGDRERFLQAGFDGYISKPIDTRSFCAEVEALLPSTLK